MKTIRILILAVLAFAPLVASAVVCIRFTLPDQDRFGVQNISLDFDGATPMGRVSYYRLDDKSNIYRTTAKEIGKVDGRLLIPVSQWDPFDGWAHLDNMARSTKKYKVGNVEYYEIKYARGAKRMVFDGKKPLPTTMENLGSFKGALYVPAGKYIPVTINLRSKTRILVRLSGPTYAKSGKKGALTKVTLRIRAKGKTIAKNSKWSSTSAKRSAVEIATSDAGLKQFPVGSKDAAIVRDLDAGSYQIRASSSLKKGGWCYLEVFEVHPL